MGKLLDLYKAIASEVQISSRLGKLLEALSQQSEASIATFAGLAGRGLIQNGSQIDVGQNPDNSIVVNQDNIQINPILQGQIASQTSTAWLAPATGTNTGARPLTAYSGTGLEDGAQVWVNGMEKLFAYDPTSTLAADNQFVVMPADGVGRFIREDVVTQAAWFVDSVAGLDTNTGSSTSPLKTVAELQTRFEAKRIVQNTTITLIGTFTTDVVALQCTQAAGTSLVVTAAATLQTTGAVTAFTALNGATDQDAEVTDATVTWALHVGRRIRLTSGANVGAIATVLKDLGAGVRA